VVENSGATFNGLNGEGGVL